MIGWQEEYDETDEQQFSTTINKLSDIATIQNIVKLAKTRLNCTLSLCVLNTEKEMGIIHFILYREEQPDLLSISELSVAIQQVLDYEHVMIHTASLFANKNLDKHFQDLIPFDENHQSEIQAFFRNHYLNIIEKRADESGGLPTQAQTSIHYFDTIGLFEVSNPNAPIKPQQLQQEAFKAFNKMIEALPPQFHNREGLIFLLEGVIASAISSDQEVGNEFERIISESRDLVNSP